MNGVYWLTSYPKSGNTWMRVLIHNLLNDEPADINDLRGTKTHGGNAQLFQDLSLLDPGLLTIEEIEDLRPAVADVSVARDPDPPFFKTHNHWRFNRRGHPVLGSAAAGALLIVRDPRDVAVSLAHHNDMEIDQVIEIMVGPERSWDNENRDTGLHLPYRQSRWPEHLFSWIEQTVLPVHIL